jgi:CRP/FNR family transcriptional regulator
MIKSLKEQALLEDLNDEELAKISKLIRKLKFKKGEYIFKEEEDTKGLYLIKAGKVEIAKVTSDGWRQPLAVFTTGQFFGELSILEKRKHQAVAIASENTEVFLIGKEGFEGLEHEISPIAFKILKKLALVMCKNLRRMNEKFLNALISY